MDILVGILLHGSIPGMIELTDPGYFCFKTLLKKKI